MPNRVKKTADLPLSTLVQGNAQQRATFGLLHHVYTVGLCQTIVQHNPAAHPLQMAFARHPFHPHFIDFGDSFGGVHQGVSHDPVIGQQNESLAVAVQTSYRKQPAEFLGD